MSKYERAMNNLNNVVLALQEVDSGEVKTTKEDIEFLQHTHSRYALEVEVAKCEIAGVHGGKRVYN